jgi:autotransporter family porin
MGSIDELSQESVQKLIDCFLLLLIALPVSSPTESAGGAGIDMVSQPIARSISAATYYKSLSSKASLPNAAQCAKDILRSDSIELVPANAPYNATIPTRSQLSTIGFYDTPTEASATAVAQVDGAFSGTTTQILRWAACKWGLDESAMKAEAWQETNWTQSTMGDWRTTPELCRAFNWNGWGMFKGPDGSTSGCYQSYGILQIKVHDFNTWDFARNSTSFNVDFRSAEQRACMNGDFTDYFKSGHGLVTGGYPTYAEAVAGKLAPSSPNQTDTLFWGCMGLWFSGGWYDKDGLNYVRSVKQWQGTQPWPH